MKFLRLCAKNRFPEDVRVGKIDLCSLTRESSENKRGCFAFVLLIDIVSLQCQWKFDQLGNSPH